MFEFINPAFVDSLNERIVLEATASTISLADAVLSLKKWVPDYAGNCIRIRRSSDNAELDIGFAGDGFVDASAITTHCGVSDGFIVTWYDQSGNGYNATQSTAGSQAQIATAGEWDGDAYAGSSIINGSDSKPAATFAADYYVLVPTNGYVSKNGTAVVHGQPNASTSRYAYGEKISGGVVFGACGVHYPSSPKIFLCHWNSASWACPHGVAAVANGTMRSIINIVDAGGNAAGITSATVYGYENNSEKFSQGSINSTLNSNTLIGSAFGSSIGGLNAWDGELRTLILFREVLTSDQRAEFNTMV
jgi:hypothetical protein|tara:strand:- start:5573 stop:6487 length:915 start_codon:yes stop_codon:yes gene_type:complete